MYYCSPVRSVDRERDNLVILGFVEANGHGGIEADGPSSFLIGRVQLQFDYLPWYIEGETPIVNQHFHVVSGFLIAVEADVLLHSINIER